MFKIGSRIVHKDKPNKFENSWEVMASANDEITLGGPGAFETVTKIPTSKQWDYVSLVAEG